MIKIACKLFGWQCHQYNILEHTMTNYKNNTKCCTCGLTGHLARDCTDTRKSFLCKSNIHWTLCGGCLEKVKHNNELNKLIKQEKKKTIMKTHRTNSTPTKLIFPCNIAPGKKKNETRTNSTIKHPRLEAVNSKIEITQDMMQTADKSSKIKP